MHTLQQVLDMEVDLNDLAPVELPPFEFNGMAYQLKEATEAVNSKYANKQLSGAEVDQSGRITRKMDGLADISTVLVSGCLWKRSPKLKDKDDAPFDTPVTEVEVRALPARMVDRLFSKAKEISGIDKQATVETIDKQIKELQRQRELLIQAQGNGSDNPNS